MLIGTAFSTLRAAKGLAAEKGTAEKAESRVFQFVAFGWATALRSLVSEGIEMFG